MIVRLSLVCFASLVRFGRSLDSSLQGFDDSVLYSINWPGAFPDGIAQEGKDDRLNYEELIVQTEKQEKYKCLIPHVIDKEKDVSDKYTGPNPLDLLGELFTQPLCSPRLEAYWTYELCHGRYIRQYHEEREGKKVKLQEYYLGRWDKTNQDKLREALENEETNRPNYPVPVKKIDGVNMPYLQLNMSDGTLCDLSSKPRLTNVLYVCYALGKHEIYSLKETSICEYEVIVLSPLLCSHPRYRPQASGENGINCMPLGKASTKPKAMLQLEVESVKLRHQNFPDDALPNVFAVFSVDSVAGENGGPRVRLEILPLNEAGEVIREQSTSARSLPDPAPAVGVDSNAFSNFLAGRDCIPGGSGWWKYEFCYGKSVTQYHVEKDGTKTVVNLGNFIKSGHLKWLAANPHKRPVPGSHLSYFYTMGSLCEETSQPRQTEVKLKCVENRNSPGAVSLYLLEPRTCQYILGVESQLICKLLQHVDADGLPISEDGIGFSRASYATGYRAQAQAPTAKGPDPKAKKRDMKVTVVLAEDDNHIADGDE